MFKDIKKQIEAHTREKLPHVFVPQQVGTIFADAVGRKITIGGILSYARKVFMLKRDNYIPTKMGFEAYGGDFITQNIASNVDGSLNDNGLPLYANVMYAVSFMPSKDATINLPYELSTDSIASLYIIRGTTTSLGDNPNIILTQRNGKVSLTLMAGEVIKILIYYYNGGSGLGFIKIFAGIAEYVGSWIYSDIYPPMTPQWYSTPLATEASDPNAATSKVRLQFLAPVEWPETGGSTGILTEPDFAGHNIYRVNNTPIITGNVGRRMNEEDVPSSVVYEGNHLSEFVYGSTISFPSTVKFLAQFNDSAIDDYGNTPVISGTPRYRRWAALGQYNTTEYIINGSFNENTDRGSRPSGWNGVNISGGNYTLSTEYLTKNDVLVAALQNSSSGIARMYQYVDTKNNSRYRASCSIVNITSGTVNFSILNDSYIINSKTISGTGETVSIDFSSPVMTGVTVAVDKVSSGITYISNISLKEIDYYRSMEFGSESRNYVKDGIFASGLDNWFTFGKVWSILDHDSTLFGHQSLLIELSPSTGILRQFTTITTGVAHTLSAYLNVYSGTVYMAETSQTSGVSVAVNSGWNRYAIYYPLGTSGVYFSSTDGAVFSVQGVQQEYENILTPFDDTHLNADAPRKPQYLKYSASGIFNMNEGTVRCWYSPYFNGNDIKNTNYTTKTLFYYENDLGHFWILKINMTDKNLDFRTYNGAIGTYQVSMPSNFTTNRHNLYHIVFTWSGSTINGWIDGIKRDLLPGYNGLKKDIIAGNYFYVGGHPTYSGYCADGAIDNFLVDVRAWTPQDIMADYYASSGTVNEQIIVSNAFSRKANLVPNSDFSSRTSMTGIQGWIISTSGTCTMSGNYSNPRFSDISLRIVTT